jgi:membrane protein
MKLSNLAVFGALAVALGAVSRHAETPVKQAAVRIGAAVAPAKPRSRNIFVRLWQDMSEDRLFPVAAGVAFYALLSLAPSLAAAVSLFGLFADPVRLAKLPDVLTTILPGEAVSLVQDEARRLASQGASSLSFKLAVAVALSLWSASAAVRALFDALNVIDEQEEKRSLIRLYATALAATLGGVVVLSLAVVLIGASPAFLSALPQEAVRLYGWLRWPLFFCVAVLVITALYWVGPSRPPASFLRLMRGAAAAALLWAIGSALFGWYVATLGNYSATYGSLATVVVMMTWMWVSSAIILMGAQLNYELAQLGK